MPNRWIEFVKTFADKHKLSYRDALRSPKCKEEYTKLNVIGKGSSASVGVVPAEKTLEELKKLREPIEGELSPEQITEGLNKEKRYRIQKEKTLQKTLQKVQPVNEPIDQPLNEPTLNIDDISISTTNAVKQNKTEKIETKIEILETELEKLKNEVKKYEDKSSIYNSYSYEILTLLDKIDKVENKLIKQYKKKIKIK